MFHRASLEDLAGADGASSLLQALGVPAPASNVRVPGPENVGRPLIRLDAAEEARIKGLIASVASSTLIST